MASTSKTAATPLEVKEFELSGETAFLVHCARLHLSERRTQAIKDMLGAGLDWDSLLKSASRRKLIPLVSYHLRSPALAPFVPGPELSKLESIHYQHLARNILLQDELGRLLKAFNRENIPVVLLKGSALLDTVYQDLSLRPMSDLDILVRPADLQRAEALVLSLDYIYRPSLSREERLAPGSRHLPNLVHRKRGIFLEVHQHIVNSDDAFYFDISGFWERSRPVLKANTEALVFSPEDSIAHLAINFLSDRRYKSNSAISQLCDISEIINQYGDSLDWDLMGRVAQENGFDAGLYSVLYACQRVMGTAVPAEVMRRLCPPRFDANTMELFLRRRVLDTRPWLAHELVGHDTAYSRRRALGAIFGRFSRLAAETFRRNEHSGNPGLFSPGRIKTVLPRVFRMVVKPSELKEDLLLDRWLHDLYRQT